MKSNHKKILTIVTASGWLLLTLVQVNGDTDAPERVAIKKVAKEFHQSLAAGKPERVMTLLQPDALIVEGGTVQTRTDYQSGHLAADIAYATAVPSKQLTVVVKQEGQVAWVTSTFRVSGSFQGNEINESAAETMVLTKTREGWRIRAVHWSSHKVAKTQNGSAK